MLDRRLFISAAISLMLFMQNAAGAGAQGFSSRGITEPLRDAKVSATVGGTIVAVDAKEGQFVKSGDVVIELDSALESLEAERRKLLMESTVEVDAARSRLETLTVDLAGTRKLHDETKSVSDEELQKKELEHKLAEADLQRQVLAQQREEIEYRMAAAQLQRRNITAPFDGVVVQLLLDVGESCSQQQPLFRIVDTRTCRLVVHMEQGPSAKLKPGRQVGLRIQESDGPVLLQGTVDFISPLIDASSGLREVKVVFDNPDGKVHPGVTGVIAGDR
jgi:RND family efflux transporter MFP subunit